MRILVADDKPKMTMVLEALFQREHYSMDVVNNGQDALDYGLEENYDCLILDIMMPKLDGIQVLQVLRAKGIATPVLLLTAKSQIEDRGTGLDSGADNYLPKPFDNREFVTRVRVLTRRRASSGGDSMIPLLRRKFIVIAILSLLGTLTVLCMAIKHTSI